MNRQKTILAVLLVILALSIGYSIIGTPRPQRVPNPTYKPGAPAAAPRSKASPAPLDDTKVHLELLEKGAPQFSGYRKNIFRPIFVEEPKPTASIPKAPVTPPTPPPPPPPPPPEPTPLQRDLGRFTFLGFLKREQNKTIFLARDREIFLVHKGDVIGGKYETVNITDDAITIRQLDGGGDIIIPLVENTALMAPSR